jgi:hypothetical protein
MARTTKPKVEETIQENIEEVKVAEIKKKVEEKPQRELEPNTMVRCMNNTTGGLTYRSMYGGKGFRIEGYGKQTRLQLQDLEALYNEQPTIITEGWLYVLDHDVVEYMYLSDLYENLISPKDVENFINLPEDEIREKLENAPTSMKNTIFKVIQDRIKKGDQQLSHISRIRFFEDVLGGKFDV